MSIEQTRLADALADRADRLDIDGPSFDDVVGRARTIRRRRRVAAGITTAAVVALIAPLGFLATNITGGSDTQPPVATDPDASDSAADFVVDGTWHRADGSEVALPRKDYGSAVIWNDQLVATYFDGEEFSVADVITADGSVAESFDTTGPVAVNEEQTTLAWIDTDGNVQTRWDDGQVEMGSVDLGAPGETVAYTVAAVTDGPDCHEAPDGNGCVVYVNSGVGEPTAFDSHGVNESPVPGAVQYFDADDDNGRLVSAVTEVADDHTCGGVYDLDALEFRFETCDFHVERLSPDGTSVAAPPSYFDGLGPTSISIIDAGSGEETGRFAPEGGFVASWAWAEDGRLLFDCYDGANWHLFAMQTDGELDELTEPVKGGEMNSPFTLIQH